MMSNPFLALPKLYPNIFYADSSAALAMVVFAWLINSHVYSVLYSILINIQFDLIIPDSKEAILGCALVLDEEGC